MQKSKGISMISLVVTIIVTILLASMAVVIGSRYLRDSKNKNTEVFVSVLSNAVSKRHEDTNLNSSLYPYLGYYINDGTVFANKFAPKIPSSVSYDDGIWYVVDTDTAASLGVSESENYITSVEESSSGNGKVALVNYAQGTVYLIDVGASDISGLHLFEEGVDNGHVHTYLEGYPTCTVPKKCINCGFIKEEALGHAYVSTAPTATEGDEENSHYTKVCSRCGMPGGYEEHTRQYVHNTGSWTHQFSCTVCGYVSASAIPCTIVYSRPDDYTLRPTIHIKTCSVCGYTEQEAHTLAYRRISYAEHERYCTDCGFVVLTDHHVDDNNDSKCDLCGADMVSYPLFRIVTMVNSSATTESGKYVAKYGDTVVLTLVADKEIRNLEVYIAGQKVPAGNMSTSDNLTWKVSLNLTSAMGINDGDISLKVTCESTTGVAIPVPITSVTDGRYVVFDGTPPILQYIKKIIRAKE